MIWCSFAYSRHAPRLLVTTRAGEATRRQFHWTQPYHGGGILHHEWIVDGQVSKESSTNKNTKTVLFLHGLLGNGKNLRSPAKMLTKRNPQISALLLDLRGHGNSSKHRGPPHTIHSCSTDVIETVRHLGLAGKNSPFGIVGHSFGGRCALQYTHQLIEERRKVLVSKEDMASSVEPPTHTWLLDTVPGKAHASVASVVNAISSVSLPLQTRKDLVKILTEEKGIEMPIASWMTTNLKKTSSPGNSGFEFMFDLDVAKSVLKDFEKQNMIEVMKSCLQDALKGEHDRQYLHLVMAGLNAAWTDHIMNDLKKLQRQSGDLLSLITLNKAGHWVHVDDLDGLVKEMQTRFCTEDK